MFKKILYKEWLKLRKTTFTLALLTICINIYIFAILKDKLQVLGIFETWYITIFWQYSFYDILKFTPLFTGLILGFFQFVPEKINHRIKLVLHLPLSPTHVISHMLIGALWQLTAVFILSFASFYVTCINSYTPIATNLILTQVTSWFFAGYVSYFCSIGVIIERNWLNKFSTSLIGFILVMVLLTDHNLGISHSIVWLHLLLTTLTLIIPYHSILSYKSGLK